MKWKKAHHARGGALCAQLGIASMWVIPGIEDGVMFQVMIGGMMIRSGKAPDVEEAKNQALEVLTAECRNLYRQASRARHPEAERLVKEAKKNFEEEGVLEFDEDAVISTGDHGSYIECWHWLPEEYQSHGG